MRTTYVRPGAVAAAVALAAVAIAAPAAAQEVPPVVEAPPSVPVFVDIDDDGVRIVGEGVDRTCSGPCELTVPPGWYDVKTKDASQHLFFDRATRVSLVRGDHTIATASKVVLIAGGAIAIAALIVPLLVCQRGERTFDAVGQLHETRNPCSDLSDGVKVAWIAGGGVGLTLAVLGGFGLVLSGPRLAVGDWRNASFSLRRRF